MKKWLEIVINKIYNEVSSFMAEKADYLGHRSRLKKRFEESGINGMLDYEVIELLLCYVIPRKDCKKNAKELIEKFGSVASILDAEIEELKSVSGVGENAALFFKFVKEINLLYLKERAEKSEQINGTLELVNYLKASLAGESIEIFQIVYLDTQNKIIAQERIFEGTVDKSHIYMRNLIERILKNRAKSVIFCHNHPSGSLKPSSQDIAFTSKAKNFLKEIEVNLLDHIIVSGRGYFSFLENEFL